MPPRYWYRRRRGGLKEYRILRPIRLRSGQALLRTGVEQGMSNDEVQLFFERCEDAFSAGGEDVVGDIFCESVGLFGGTCDLAPDEILAIQT